MAGITSAPCDPHRPRKRGSLGRSIDQYPAGDGGRGSHERPGSNPRRGTVHIPIWPAAVVVLAATAVVIGLSTFATDTIAPARPLVTVTDAQRLANSTAAIREQGAVAPVVVGISHVTPKAVGPVGITRRPRRPSCRSDTWGSRTRGAYLPRSAYPNGLENPTAYARAKVLLRSPLLPRRGSW